MSKTYMIVRHQVADYSRWKPIYDEHLIARQWAGLKELHLLHNVENPNDLTLFFEVEDIGCAKAFMNSSETADKIKEAHVIGTPEICFLSP
jgi:hypothetical protein